MGKKIQIVHKDPFKKPPKKKAKRNEKRKCKKERTDKIGAIPARLLRFSSKEKAKQIREKKLAQARDKELATLSEEDIDFFYNYGFIILESIMSPSD